MSILILRKVARAIYHAETNFRLFYLNYKSTCYVALNMVRAFSLDWLSHVRKRTFIYIRLVIFVGLHD